jgi:hypothetical protein
MSQTDSDSQERDFQDDISTTSTSGSESLMTTDNESEDEMDPWQTLIHEAKLQLLDTFQENVENLNNEGFSEVEAKRQSFSELLPKLTK